MVDAIKCLRTGKPVSGCHYTNCRQKRSCISREIKPMNPPLFKRASKREPSPLLKKQKGKKHA